MKRALTSRGFTPEGRKRFDYEVQGVRYRNLPVVQYRVWCRERLQDHLAAVPNTARAAVEALLQQTGGLEPLQRDGRIASKLYDGPATPVCQPRPVSALEKLGLYFTGTSWRIPRLSLSRK